MQDGTQGVDAEVPSVQRDQHIGSRAWGAWDEHGLVGGDERGWEEQEGEKDEIYPWVGEWAPSVDLPDEAHELE